MSPTLSAYYMEIAASGQGLRFPAILMAREMGMEGVLWHELGSEASPEGIHVRLVFLAAVATIPSDMIP